LQLILNDTVRFYSKIIVGKPDKPTPLLSSMVDCIVLFPYWYVPRKIAVEEYLPIIQHDSSFITRNNFEILRRGLVVNPDSIDWQMFNENYFPVSLRQREGTENSLGVIKFVFDNPYAVYLHDTNSKRSFSNKMRALSHGCVRVEKAIDLAHILVTGDLIKKSNTITRYLKKEERHAISLSKPMPIYIRYITCEYRNDVLYCYADIYNQDAKLLASFYGNKMFENSME
jgi:murein L,D-transpeptidase YcbB/YkuD